jgi:hypothetical protein
MREKRRREEEQRTTMLNKQSVSENVCRAMTTGVNELALGTELLVFILTNDR